VKHNYDTQVNMIVVALWAFTNEPKSWLITLCFCDPGHMLLVAVFTIRFSLVSIFSNRLTRFCNLQNRVPKQKLDKPVIRLSVNRIFWFDSPVNWNREPKFYFN